MANGTTTDFEKYPKYQLDKHGKVIKQILKTAEDVFGMADSQPIIKKKVGGGQNIVNEDDKPAIFTDDLTPNESEGKIYISPLNKSVAIANYATNEDIVNMFKTPTDSDDSDSETTLVTAPTPVIAFSEDKTKVISYKLDENGETTTEENTEPLYYNIDTDVLGSLKTSHSWYQAAIELPELNPRVLSYQVIKAVTPGDDIETYDSEPALLYRISPGLPVSSATIDSAGNKEVCIMKPTADFLKEENKVPVLTNPDLTNKVYYYVDKCDYGTGVITTGEIIEVDESVKPPITLGIGECLFSGIDCQFNSAAENPTHTADNTIRLTAQVKYTNFKKLPAPNIMYNSVNKLVTVDHVDPINEEVKTNRCFIYSIKKYNEDIWSAEVVSTNGKLEVTLEHTGDVLRVKSRAEFYNDSSYEYCTACECTDNGASEGDTTLAYVDLEASNIAEAKAYTPTDSDWYGGDITGDTE